MRETGEIIFDLIYLCGVIALGVTMIRRAPKGQYRLFGIMAVVLGLGDAFHLVPRMYALATTGSFAGFVVPLGIGKWITSITMTVFYVILYEIWRKRYTVTGQTWWTYLVYLLAACRIILCFFPQNQWLAAAPNLAWGIYRNIPFALLGLVDIVLFFRSAWQQDRPFRWLWLTIVISFAMYIPVVLWSHSTPNIGLLMIPKTCAYVWTILIGYWAMKKELRA